MSAASSTNPRQWLKSRKASPNLTALSELASQEVTATQETQVNHPAPANAEDSSRNTTNTGSLEPPSTEKSRRKQGSVEATVQYCAIIFPTIKPNKRRVRRMPKSEVIRQHALDRYYFEGASSWTSSLSATHPSSVAPSASTTAPYSQVERHTMRRPAAPTTSSDLQAKCSKTTEPHKHLSLEEDHDFGKLPNQTVELAQYSLTLREQEKPIELPFELITPFAPGSSQFDYKLSSQGSD